jgi:hypothetical protein
MTVCESAGGAQRETAPKARGCTDGEHRCEALALAFFALWHTGAIDDATRAAARCDAGLI